MFDFFANIFGYVLNFIYNFVGNYGLAIIIFTILLKLVMLPFSIKQQKINVIQSCSFGHWSFWLRVICFKIKWSKSKVLARLNWYRWRLARVCVFKLANALSFLHTTSFPLFLTRRLKIVSISLFLFLKWLS